MIPGGRFGQDFWAGAVFVALGTVAVVAAQEHALGTAMRMGPAYFPTLLGGILALLGAAIILRALGRGDVPVGAWPLRPMIVLPLAILAFALLLRPVGLVGATAVLVLISALASREWRPREVLPLAIGLAALVVAIFVHGLGLPFRIWPRF